MVETLTIQSTKTLLSGHKIPSIGFGVFESPPDVTKASVTAALEAGYRHFDSAQYYENEEQVGEAIRAAYGSLGLDREQLFVTSKILSPVEEDVDATFASLRQSVERTGLGYLDLFLIHTPSSGPRGRKIMWSALERLLEAGLTKSIGVSNFGIRHLKEIEALGGTLPAVNQIELHPYLQQRDIVEYCQAKQIVVEAYCPLTRGERFTDEVLLDIGNTHHKHPAQILIRWSLQKDFVPLPKSDTKSRIIDNANVYDFELSHEEMDRIDALNEDKSIFHNPVDAE